MRHQILRIIVTTVINIDITMPIRGAKNINKIISIIVFDSITFAQLILTPLVAMPCAIAAPASPPISVCDDDDGMPYHQVSKFQKMAAISPANITGKVINSLCTVLLMVLATA